MKAFVFLADGFEEIEAMAPVDLFRRGGIETITVSVNRQLTVTGAHGITVVADTLFDNNDYSENDLLYLPGGMPGTTHLDQHEGLKQLIEKHNQQQKPIAAICAAPSILGKMGLLEGKNAISYPGFEKFLYGANISTDKIVKSETIFTAQGAGVAIPFALKLVEEFRGKKASEDLAASICY